jgi:capsular exopolysaccharide synthesis family protein
VTDSTSLAPRIDRPPITAFAAPPRSPSSEIPAAELRLMTYLRAVARRWPIVAATAVLAAVLTYAYAISLPKVYEARARILVEAQAPNVVTFTPVREEGANSEYYATQFELLRSRGLAERTIESLGLWSDPELAGDSQSEGDRRGEAASPDKAPEGPASGAVATSGHVESRRGVIGAFLERLDVSQVKQSRLVQIAFRAEDPALAARVANAHAQTFIERSLEDRVRPSTDAAASLQGLLADQRRQVDASEEALQRYREQHGHVSLREGEDIAQQRLLQLSAALTSARAERLQKGALYEQLRAIEESRASLDTFPAFLSNRFIQQFRAELLALQTKQAQLQEQLGDLHPDMVQIRVAIASTESKLKAEIAKAAEAVQNEYKAAQASERALGQAVADQQREALARDRTGIEYANLQRAAATNRQIYESLLQRSKETAVAGSIQSGTVRLVDAAEVPGAPLPRGEKLYALLAIFWGGALGLGLVFLVEFSDRRIKSPEDLELHLALPYVGFAPLAGKEAGLRLIGAGAPPEFTEALRTIGATLLGSVDETARSVLVTSATSGEGKTMVSGHLALTLARIGKRVALVDADLRRPRLHEMLGVSRGPGLVDVITGSARLKAAIHETTTPNLWLLPAGQPVHSSDLLGGERVPQLIAALTQAFDWVIIDSPPVLAVADASFLAQAVAAVLMVVDAHSTKREMVQAAVERLEAVQARPLGAVLNRANLHRRGDSYYYYYPIATPGDPTPPDVAATPKAS